MTENIDARQVLERLPHRYPFLLIDRVLEFEADRRIVAIKNVTINEPFFPGHFPGYPVMPGVMIIESLAQACGLLASLSAPERDDTILLFTGIDKTRFKRQVIPGDRLRLEASVLKKRRGIWRFRAEAQVEGRRACAADLMCAEQKL